MASYPIPPEPTRFAFVAEWVWNRYHKDREKIARDWPHFQKDLDMWETHARMRVAAITNLRDDVLEALDKGHGGPYLVPV